MVQVGRYSERNSSSTAARTYWAGTRSDISIVGKAVATAAVAAAAVAAAVGSVDGRGTGQ